MSWEAVIGLEIHVQLATQSKLFSGAATAYGAAPNTQACALDLGMPGVLPVINREAVRMAVRFGLAVGARIAPQSVFARKNYFYPDLPKGYQISQYELPIVTGGSITIECADGGTRAISITRAHLEEDAGKSLHEGFGSMTGIDLNRAGTPLIEIVSEPELRSAAEAGAYMRKIHTLVRYLGISDGNMQEGSFRCDANVSVRRVGETALGTRAEIKNLNSFRFVEQAVEFEIARQTEMLESGGTVVQETRLYDAERGESRSMRSKEDAHDYRYFPDPDLLAVKLDEEEIEQIRATLPELPDAKRERFCDQYDLNADDAAQLTASAALAAYYEAVCSASGGEHRLSANWVTGELAAALNRENLDVTASPVAADALGTLIARIADGTISGRIGKQVFEAMWRGEGGADQIIAAQGLQQVSDSTEISRLVEAVIAAHPEQVKQYRDGNAKVLGYLVGQVMKQSAGKANPKRVNELLREMLNR